MRRFLVAGSALAVAFFALPVAAEDAPIARVPAVTEQSDDPAVKAFFENAHAKGIKPINLQLVLQQAPPLAKASGEGAYAIRFSLKVPRPYRELTILRTVQNWEGHYEFNQHHPMALACGFSEAQINGLAHWRTSKLFDAKQRAVLAYVDQITKRPGKVSDATFVELGKYFPPNEIVELSLTAGQYMGTAAFTNAIKLQIETDGRQAEIGKC